MLENNLQNKLQCGKSNSTFSACIALFPRGLFSYNSVPRHVLFLASPSHLATAPTFNLLKNDTSHQTVQSSIVL